MQKITIRDLISCELTKSKLDSALDTTTNNPDTSIPPKNDADRFLLNHNESSESTASSTHFRVLTSSSSSFPLDISSTFCTKSQLQQQQQQSNCEKENQQESTSTTNNNQLEASDENIIVIYDDTTSDDKDLLVESNPLKIVQENIKKAGIRKECKILKGIIPVLIALCPCL